jgi:hypothetical protein
MTRRFWIGGALALPVFLLAMAHAIPVAGSRKLGDGRHITLDSICPLNARGAVGGLAILQARLAFARHATLEHVHAHRHWRGHGLFVQRSGDAHAGRISDFVRTRWQDRNLFRGGSGDCRAGAARSGARIAGAEQNRQRHPRLAESCAQNRAGGSRQRRTRRAVGIRSSRSEVARAPRRKNSGGRRFARRENLGGRIHDFRRADSRGEKRRRQSDRRHAQHHRQFSHASRTRRQRDRAGPNRQDGRRRATQPRADSGVGGQSFRLFCSGSAGLQRY